MTTAYILIADSHRARCFERETVGGTLVELEDFVSPHGKLAREGHGRTAHAGTQFEPATSEAGKERARFAQQIADHLNAAVAEHRARSLILIATSPMLGDIVPRLTKAAALAVSHKIDKDLTHFTGPELTERVKKALDASA